MDQVLTYDKTFQQRYEEYKTVLKSKGHNSIEQVLKKWSTHLALTIGACHWQALWKIPRQVCEKYKISFPNVVLVEVLDIAFDLLVAAVKITAVQDDVKIPLSQEVSLNELWPIKYQINIDAIANALDSYRFFRNHLLMPWDYNEDEDWISAHLEPRLHLFYDMNNGLIEEHACEYFKGILSEARRLQSKREEIEACLRKNEKETGNLDVGDANVEKLAAIHVRLTQIRVECELFENPLSRECLIKTLRDFSERVQDEKKLQLVFEQGDIDQFMTFFNKAKEFSSGKLIKVFPNLTTALEFSFSEQFLILNRSRHVISTFGIFGKCGGSIRGLYHKIDTIITSNRDGLMMDLSGKTALHNLTIDASDCQCGILIRKCETIINNCRIIGDGESSIHQGIIALSGSCLILRNCEIINFYTGIIGNSHSKIIMENCEIFGCHVGLKVYDQCCVNVKNCSFHDCKGYGIFAEYDNWLYGEKKVAKFKEMPIIPGVEMDEVYGENNGKGDFIVSKKPTLHPV